MPTTLRRLESATSDPRQGGCLFTFTPTYGKTLAWESGAPIRPVLDAAKKYVADLMGQLMAEDSLDSRAAIRETNWVSVTAAMRKILFDWNTRLVASLHAADQAAGSRMVS